ncbi:MAG: hypothetical protein IJY12_01365 [Clostridia bacterium]|nr:hypothetical protein [Clostridia bacterium]
MEYKIELHCHCKEVSLCADADTKLVAKKYLEAGYSTIVLTNHFNHDTIRSRENETYEDFLARYISAADKLQAEVGDRITVLLGMEIRFPTNWNDYLVYGMTPEFLYAYPNILDMDLGSFRQLVNENGMLLFQAHPFRFGMTTTNPKFLDGIESHNGHPHHNSNNDIAEAWAEKYGLLHSAGSDYHHERDVPTSGIISTRPIRTSKDLIDVLKTGDFTIIR